MKSFAAIAVAVAVGVVAVAVAVVLATAKRLATDPDPESQLCWMQWQSPHQCLPAVARTPREQRYRRA